MVAIVSGNSLGLELSSLATLGARGLIGEAASGAGGQRTYVNIASGNLVLSARDENLAGRGMGVEAIRTYNSQGLVDQNGGGLWQGGVQNQRLRYSGALPAAGGSLALTLRDGAVAVYDWDAARDLFVSTTGAGAHDTVRHDAAARQFVHTDGDSGLSEIYRDSGEGRLLATVDRDGNRSEHEYDASGRLLVSRSASGEEMRYDYEQDRLAAIRLSQADGAALVRVRYLHDGKGRLASVLADLTPEDGSISDGRLYRTDYAYDGDSTRIRSVRQSDGSGLDFAYVQVGGSWRVASVADALGQTTRYDYDTAGRRTTVTDALGVATTYVYDEQGQLLEVGQPGRAGSGSEKPAMRYAYDGQGNLVEMLDGEDHAIRMAYDERGNQISWRDAAGNTVRRSFDENNLLRSETLISVPVPGASAAGAEAGIDPSAAAPLTSRHVYDSKGKGQLRFFISAEGRVTQYFYNAYGERTGSLAYAAARFDTGTLSENEVPDEDRMLAWAAATGTQGAVRIDMAYDARGLLSSQTAWASLDAGGAGVSDGGESVTRYLHDQAGRLLQGIAADGGTSSQVYDGLGRVISMRDALGKLVLTSYDDAGARTTQSFDDGRSSASQFDRAGRLLSVLVTFKDSGAVERAAGSTDYAYDAAGHVVMTRDPTGVRTWMLYDEQGIRVADIDGDGSLTEYRHDANGQVILVTRYATAVDPGRLVDEQGRARLPELDLLRPPGTQDDVRSWQFYDAAGRLARSIDAGGAVTDRFYDAASRLVRTVAHAALADTGSGAIDSDTFDTVYAGLGALTLLDEPQRDRITRYFHDADGLLIATLDGEGYLRENIHDASGALVSTIAYAQTVAAQAGAHEDLAALRPQASAQDVVTHQLHDGQRRLIAQVDGEGYLTRIHYSESGHVMVTVRHARAVDAALRQRLMQSPAGIALSELDQLATPDDVVTTRRTDLLGRLVEEQDGDGVSTLYTYDANGRLSRTERAAGSEDARISSLRYDGLGRLVAELSGVGSALLSGAASAEEVETIWTRYGIRHSYDDAGRLLSTTDQFGSVTRYFHDADGRQVFVLGADGAIVENRYDTLGRLSELIQYARPLATARAGDETGSASASAGSLTLETLKAAARSVQDERQDSHTRYSYDHAGRLIASVDAAGFSSTRNWNAFGEEEGSSAQLAEGKTVLARVSYDRRGLKVAVVQDATGLDARTQYSYDAFGRLVSSAGPGAAVESTVYDRNGRTVQFTDASGGTRLTAYDAFDRVLSRTDVLGQVSRYQYGRDPRSITVTTPENHTVTTWLNRHGQTLAVTDANGNHTTYRYDADGNLLGTVTPLTQTSERHDHAGRLISSTDANGIETVLEYDAVGHVITRSIDPQGLNLQTRYFFDVRGRQVGVSDANGVRTDYVYDRKGQLISQTVDPGGLNLRTSFDYDGLGRTLRMTEPGGASRVFVYDALGRRTEEHVDADGLDLVRRYAYDVAGNMVRSTDANGNVTRHVHDAAGRLIFTVDPLGQVRRQDWDAAGRLVGTTVHARAIDPSGLGETPTAEQIMLLLAADPDNDVRLWQRYDAEGRLVASMNGLGEVTAWRYDGNGNVIEERRFANRADLSGWAAGSAIVFPAPDAQHDQVRQTVFDAANRAIYRIDANGAVTAQSFDGNGNLTQSVRHGVAFPAGTETTAQAVVASLFASASGTAAAEAPSSRRERFFYDAGGRLIWQVDAAGAVTQTIHDARGQPVRVIQYANALSDGSTPAQLVASAEDRITDLVHDSAGRLSWTIDALGQITRNIFDANGNPSVSIAYGVLLAPPSAASAPPDEQGIYQALGTAVVPDVARDRIEWRLHDAAGRAILKVDAAGAVTEKRYDAVGNVVETRAYANPVDSAGLLLQLTGAGAGEAAGAGQAGLPTQLTARLTALLRPDSLSDRLTTQTLDAADRVVQQTDAEGYVSRMTYDGFGRLLSTTRGIRPDGAESEVRTEKFRWDQQGRLSGKSDALGHTERYTYDALGNKRSFTNKNNATWLYDYDAAGQLIQETSPLVELVRLVAGDGTSGPGNPDNTGDTQSGVLTRDDAHSGMASIVTRLDYDVFGDLRTRTEASGRPEQRSTRYEYDALGRQVKTIHAPVGVYRQASDDLAVNGTAGLAQRQDSLETLASVVVYDVFGNAIANRDLSGSLSYRIYDRLGRVRHEIDALGYVVSHEYTVWGDAAKLTRYADAVSLADAVDMPADAALLAARAGDVVDHLARTLETPAFYAGPARVLESRYDQRGRLLTTIAPQVFNYDASAAPGQQYFLVGQTVRYSYNAFGDRVRSESLINPLTELWSTTGHWFNRRSEEVATVDTLGYLSTRRYDSAGQLVEQVEYAQALPRQAVNAASAGQAAPQATVLSDDDRRVLFAYDLAGRKIMQTRANVEASEQADGRSARMDLVEHYSYDALGNLVRSTDASGAATLTYYDALGRISAVVSPARSSTADGSALMPLSTFGRDAYGNVVLRTDHAGGVSQADQHGFAMVAGAGNDRRTLAVFDSFGRMLRQTDASGADVYSSWNVSGQLAKQWQMVSANDGSSRTLFQAWQYDSLGRQTAVLSATQQGLTANTSAYNGYGELVSRGRDGASQEYFEYDQAGRLWRTNGAGAIGADGGEENGSAGPGAGSAAGDGVDKVFLYDLAGQVNAEIRSGGAGRADLDLRAYGSADQVAVLEDVQRTDTLHDAMGRVLQQAGAERLQSQGGVTVRRSHAHATISASGQTQVDESGRSHFYGSNTLLLAWTTLSGLGSGDVKVIVDYETLTTPSYRGIDESGNPELVRDESGMVIYPGHSVSRSLTRIVTAQQGDSGLRLDWKDNGEADGGLGRVTRLQVYKKDVAGNWQAVVDQATLGYTGNSIEVAAPADPDTALVLQLRLADSTADPEAGWQIASLVAFGDAARFDASALPFGEYEYRVLTMPRGAAARVSAAGRLSLTAVPLSVIATPLSFSALVPGSLTWSSPGPGVTQSFRWRPQGGGVWQSAEIETPVAGGQGSAANLKALPPGTYEVELLWQHDGEDSAFAHLTGTVDIVAEVPGRWVAQVGYPPIAPLAVGETIVGGTPVGFDESGLPVRSGGKPGAILEWPPQNGTLPVFRYRLSGTEAWATLAVESVGGSLDESGNQVFASDESGHPSGRQFVVIAGLAPGDYDYVLEQTGSAGSYIAGHARGTLTVAAANAGHYETRDVHVRVPQTVTPAPAEQYIVGWTGQGPAYGPPVVVGTDAAGQPIFGAGYGRDIVSSDESGNGIVYGPVRAIPYDVWHTEIRTETVAVQVQTGQQPVPLLDESGNPVTMPLYETRQSTREEAYQVQVQGEPIISGIDEAGNPVYARDESGAILHHISFETRYRTVQFSYQVEVGRTPVYATDESGNVLSVPVYETQYRSRDVEVQVATRITPADPAQFIISAHSGVPIYGYPVVVGTDESGTVYFGKGYGVVDGEVRAIPYEEMVDVVQSRQVWVDGTTPAPIVRDATPPYIPAHAIARQPQSWRFTATTTQGSGSASQPAGILNQIRQVDGDTLWLRPVILQELDRWGNVITLSDARSSAWLTRYRYNASNQLIQAFAPQGDGSPSAVPTGELYYDQLDRQVATRDANGNLNGSVWDQGGNLVREQHADGGVIVYRYDAFGNRIGRTDAMGNVSTSRYDAMGRLLQLAQGPVEVFDVDGANNLHLVGPRVLVESMGYDQAGRKLWSSNGNGETIRYSYDPAGNVTSVTSPMGQVSRASFDAAGNKVGEIDANGYGASWQYDYFGRLVSRVDLGGATVSYRYDHAGQLLGQTSSRGQNLAYAYDGAGQLLSITDAALGQVSSYQYDLSGRRIREKTVQAGVVYQDNRLAYDALGRLRKVSDGRVSIDIDYDRAGNRQRIFSHVIDASDRSQDSTRYFAYDAMNRQILVDGVDAAGTINAQQGNRITYDRNGNRTSDTSWGNHVSAIQVLDHYELREVYGQTGVDESNQPVFGLTESSVPIYRTEYLAAQGESTETYTYDALDRLASVSHNGTLVDARHYDAGSRVVSSGPEGRLPVGYVNALNGLTSTGQTAAGNGSETRINRYDANGRLLHQRVLKSDNSAKFDIDYSSYDAAGNLLAYTLQNHDGEAYTNTYRYTNERFDGYSEARIDGSSDRFEAGSTVQQHDVNGYLTAISDATKPANDRRFVNDAAGRALYVEQAGRVLRQLVVDGEVLGSHGQAVDPTDPVTGNGEPNFIASADFNFGYRSVGGNYPQAAPGLHVVAAGDTLAGIARVEYGDSQLWYLIAAANGLRGDADLRVGQALSVPNRVTTVHNGSDTFRPYDPTRAAGDTTPNLPVVAQGGGSSGASCGGVGTILVAVVAVAVAAMSGQWYLANIATPLTSAGAATSSAAGMTAASLSAGATAATVYGADSLVVAGAVSGAMGAIAGQLTGNAVGIGSGFNWKEVALGALGGGVASGLSLLNGLPASSIGSAAVRGAMTNALTQGIAVVSGLQRSFNWRGVAGAALAAGVGASTSAALNSSLQGESLGPGFGMDMASLFTRSVSTIAGNLASATVRGGRIDMSQIATDAFGNALAESLAASNLAIAEPDDVTGAFALDQSDDSAPNYFDSHPMMYASTDLRGISLLQVAGGITNAIDDGRWNRVDVPVEDYPEAPSVPELSAAGAAMNTATPFQVPYPEVDVRLLGVRSDAESAALLSVPQYDALGNYQGLDASISADAAGMSYGQQMRATGNFVDLIGKNFGIGAAQGAIGIASEAAKGWAMVGDLFWSGGEHISQLEKFDLRPFSYDQGAGEFAGMAGEMLNPGIALKGIKYAGVAAQWVAPEAGVLLENYAARTGMLMRALPESGKPTSLLDTATESLKKGFDGATIRTDGMAARSVGQSGYVYSELRPGVVDLSNPVGIPLGLYRADPRQLRHTQATVSPNFSDRHTISSTVDQLRVGRLSADEVGSPLEVVIYNGLPFSMDNRRLVAFNLAGVDNVKIQIMDLSNAKVGDRFFRRFNPINGEGRYVIVVKSKSQQEAQHHLKLSNVKRGEIGN